MSATRRRMRPYLKTVASLTFMGAALVLSACGNEKAGLKDDVSLDSFEVSRSIVEGAPVYGIWTVAVIKQESITKTKQIRMERGKITATTICESPTETVKAFAASVAVVSHKTVKVMSTAQSQRFMVVNGLRYVCDATVSAEEFSYVLDGETISVTHTDDTGLSERWRKAANL